MKKLEDFLKDVERVAEGTTKLLPGFKPEMRLYLACDLKFVRESDYKPKLGNNPFGETVYRPVYCRACLNVEYYSQVGEAIVTCRELFDKELKQRILISVPGVGEVEADTDWIVDYRYFP